MSGTIRAFEERDYEAVVKLWNASFPDYLVSVPQWRKADRERPGHIVLKRYVLEQDGAPAAFGSFNHSEDAFEPHTFWVNPVVPPAAQGRGYGLRLFEHMLEALEPHRPRKLLAFSREDWLRRNRFLARQGFGELSRSFESRLEVAAFDPQPYAGLEAELAERGIALKSYAELEDDAERERKIYHLHTTLDRDVPMLGAYSKPSFERFAQFHWGDERFLPEGYLLAIRDGAYVGLSELFRRPVGNGLETGLTGVLREHRRQGVALALKVKGVAFAERRGAPVISTWNAGSNRGMLAINERLGYVKQPASLELIKQLGAA